MKYQNWFKRAKEDLISAKANLKIKRYYIASFLSQQSAEKALKAFLIKKDDKLIKVHDISYLARKLSLPKEIVEACERLNPVYIETRYPDAAGDFKSYTKNEAKSDVKDAEKVLKWIKEEI